VKIDPLAAVWDPLGHEKPYRIPREFRTVESPILAANGKLMTANYSIRWKFDFRVQKLQRNLRSVLALKLPHNHTDQILDTLLTQL
jgi:hypothetical protein